MYSPTYGELKADLQKELDIEDETFITPLELLNYFNEAMTVVSSEIHTIYEDYFLAPSTTISLVSGTSKYDMPDDIFAQKIRSLMYDDGSAKKYEIRRIKQIKEIPFITSTDLYRYIIVNDLTDGIQIELYPTPQETNTNVKIRYLRSANKFTGDDEDVCDIPEFSNVVVQYAKWKCLCKEGHPDANTAAAVLDGLRKQMVETLMARVPDEDNEVIKDTTFYDDFDDWFYTGGSF